MQIYWEADKGTKGDPPTEQPVKDPPQEKPEIAKEEIPGPVPYDRFQEVNDKNKELAMQLKAIEETQEKLKTEDAEKQGKFEELYAEEKGKRETAQLDLLRNQVAIEKGLPKSFVDRLQGDSRAAMVKDADAILEVIEDAKKGGKGVPGITDRRAADRSA